ncbi:MAG TPA: hypothetical protein VD973_16375 [Symbiobacteriaceae bacterium]|nr:hypothetical protein [Symbiobacteriaceae bacterium]
MSDRPKGQSSLSKPMAAPSQGMVLVFAIWRVAILAVLMTIVLGLLGAYRLSVSVIPETYPDSVVVVNGPISQEVFSSIQSDDRVADVLGTIEVQTHMALRDGKDLPAKIRLLETPPATSTLNAGYRVKFLACRPTVSGADLLIDWVTAARHRVRLGDPITVHLPQSNGTISEIREVSGIFLPTPLDLNTVVMSVTSSVREGLPTDDLYSSMFITQANGSDTLAGELRVPDKTVITTTAQLRSEQQAQFFRWLTRGQRLAGLVCIVICSILGLLATTIRLRHIWGVFLSTSICIMSVIVAQIIVSCVIIVAPVQTEIVVGAIGLSFAMLMAFDAMTRGPNRAKT